ncbi:MAG: GspE/PulE family protein [Alphaproteobacteria bacterium]|nr:GspE/PulE family protein [Alphaproteobacteria bacterium]
MKKVVPLRARSPDSEEPEVRRLGELLLASGKVTQDQIQIALHEQRQSKERLGMALVRLGFIDDKALAQALALHSGKEAIDLKTASIDRAVLSRVPHAVAERCCVAPLSLEQNVLRVAVADPFDIRAIDEIRRYFPRKIDVRGLIAPQTQILETLGSYARGPGEFTDILNELEGVAAQPKESEARTHPVVRLVDALLTDAVREGASDIHLEPEASFVRLRIRVDGVLRQKRAVHLSYWPQISHRLKIMAGMNIADTRGMQDGRFHMQISGSEIDFRVAAMPTVHGENIVIRVLDHRRALLPLDALGYDAAALKQFQRVLERPEGIVLVTGPTGSGKTTTLYAVLKQLSSVDVNIMTLEEPVEYEFELIRQTAIQEQQGIGFAEGVRGILRQAPDIIFVGEIRDDDTARMALRAAMTGHQVFSTLHCNDSFGALPRLSDLGLSPRTLSGNIIGIVAQRLVRNLCPKCKRVRPATAEECEILSLESATTPVSIPGFAEAQTPFEPMFIIAGPTGCPHCNGTGYKGRSAVVEILNVTQEIDELIARDAPQAALRAQAKAQGFRPMGADGIAKVLRQETSLEELRRNVDLTRAK